MLKQICDNFKNYVLCSYMCHAVADCFNIFTDGVLDIFNKRIYLKDKNKTIPSTFDICAILFSDSKSKLSSSASVSYDWSFAVGKTLL